MGSEMCIRDSQGTMNFNGQSANMASSCGMVNVASGSLNEDSCTNLYTLGMGVPQRSDKQCTFKMWTGVSTCDGDGSVAEIVIPQGNATTCINTGVEDGGKWYKASGIYSCC